VRAEGSDDLNSIADAITLSLWFRTDKKQTGTALILKSMTIIGERGGDPDWKILLATGMGGVVSGNCKDGRWSLTLCLCSS